MRTLGKIIGIFLIILGGILILGAFTQNPIERIISGIVMGGIGIVIMRLSREPVPQNITIKREIELSGDINLEILKCKNCGGTLSKKDIEIVEGTAIVSCPYCSVSYQMEEEPKW
ncbi:MAG: hypothetical protein A2161_07450 [Candidatus Schekmanbacteria bacterium RBG_13_48_7]|uniref:Uncharacterized protein n=1 Tax=Candidatus Schekmanbacteria bacterium RBG_13_48_7 TaxID=1817878 RepID=A0A1F7RN04_9BACT|nr:MAG: hypothetical protein A2161_07450 [Candidatus Schekmanbacteria bacterium RBG_13_48_7]